MICGLLGEKLGHSYSPRIHGLLGDYTYTLFEKKPEELEDWVLDDGATEYLLHKTPVLLKARAEYEQMRLF